MKKGWEKFTDKFGCTILHPQFIMLSFKEEAIREVIKYGQNKKVIDLGCGRMTYKERLEEYVENYVGVDDPKVSKLYTGRQKPDLLADITREIPVKKDSFDVCMMLEVLEYLERPQTTFLEIKRILKRGGVLVMTSPFLYPLHDVPYDRNRFTEWQIKHFLEENELKIRKIKENGNFLAFWMQALDVFLLKTIMDILKSKKRITSLLFLLILVIFSPFVIIGTNIIYLLTKNVNLGLANYFPLGYLVVATKL